jgi:hypothetical protein
MTDTDHTDHEREALALRHVFQQSTDDRADMLVKLEESALPLLAVIAHARTIHRKAPQAQWEDVRAELLRVKAVRITDDIKAVMDGPAEPTAAAAAYKATLNASDDIRDKRAAAAIAEALKKPGWGREVERIMESQHRREVATEDLAEGWANHVKMMRGGKANAMQAIKLNPKRGDWAETMNAWLGVRGGLMPGRSLLIGGGANGGKTSLASVFAWDALAAGCPVTLYQLELGRFEGVEYLMRQNPDKSPSIYNDPMPSHWPRLLDAPTDASPDGRDADEALKAMVRRAERLRRGDGEKAHAANGLFILDYAQLLAKPTSGDAFHETLANAVSKLVKTAANTGACIIVASQVNKSAQRGALDLMSYAGADLGRLTHVAVTIEKATYEKDEFTPVGSNPATKLNGCEARYINRQKERGMCHDGGTPEGFAGVWIRSGTLMDEPDDKPQGNRAPKRLPQA